MRRLGRGHWKIGFSWHKAWTTWLSNTIYPLEKTKMFGKFFTETNPSVIAEYSETDGKHYDDAIMRKAVEDVKKSGKFYYYKALGNGRNNCQDFVESVTKRYWELFNQ